MPERTLKRRSPNRYNYVFNYFPSTHNSFHLANPKTSNIKSKEGLAVKSTAYLILSSTFNGIDKITGVLIPKADYRRSSKMRVN